MLNRAGTTLEGASGALRTAVAPALISPHLGFEEKTILFLVEISLFWESQRYSLLNLILRSTGMRSDQTEHFSYRPGESAEGTVKRMGGNQEENKIKNMAVVYKLYSLGYFVIEAQID